jgi:hypothetical protein
MADFFPEVNLTRSAAEAIARGLYAIARVDGLHEREAGLIASFWIDAGGGDVALSDLERGADIAPAELATALTSSEERQLFVKTAILLTYADGTVSEAEKFAVGKFAQALAVDGGTVDKLEASVKDFLMAHVAHLQNTEATVAVSKKLG